MTITTIIIGLACLVYAFVVDLRGDGLRTPARAAIALGLGLAIVLGGIGAAHAAEFEASIGKTVGMNNQAYSFGFTGVVHDGLRWRTGYANLGAPSYTNNSAWTTPDDILEGAGPGPFMLQSPKNDTELYFTLAPEIYRGNWTFSVEGGFGIYRPNSLEDLPPSQANPDKTSLAFTPIIGASIGYGKTSIVVSMQHMMTRADVDSGPAFSNRQITTSIRYRF